VINLELSTYLKNRGAKKLNFKKDLELKDPYGVQDKLLPEKAKGL